MNPLFVAKWYRSLHTDTSPLHNEKTKIAARSAWRQLRTGGCGHQICISGVAKEVRCVLYLSFEKPCGTEESYWWRDYCTIEARGSKKWYVYVCFSCEDLVSITMFVSHVYVCLSCILMTEYDYFTTGDVCVSLIWNNRNDCDLHVKVKCKCHLYWYIILCGNNADTCVSLLLSIYQSARTVLRFIMGKRGVLVVEGIWT